MKNIIKKIKNYFKSNEHVSIENKHKIYAYRFY